jgi:hypothetical protein
MNPEWQDLAVFEDATMNERVMKQNVGDGISLSDAEFIAALAEKRAVLMRQLKAALLAGEDAQALELARAACGLEPKPETKQ